MEYREELRRQSVDEDSALVVVPDSFQIRETRYTPESGQVTARLFFNFDTYRERREYTYELQRRDGFWEIVGYQVSNLPNEALDR
jgi:hypothetical protein